MKRLLPYRNQIPETVSARLALLEPSTSNEPRPFKLFLVQTLGPTLFLIRHESQINSTDTTTTIITTKTTTKKYKVAIGNPQRCSCGDKELCVHILFCMTKVLGVPKDNPLTWQRALVEREINNVCSGQVARAARAAREAASSPNSRRQRHTNFLRRRKTKSLEDGTPGKSFTAERKPIENGDTCPVCLEDLDEAEENESPNKKNLVYCKKGCGKNVHVACMLVWAEHQSDIKKKITCPLCRVDWGPLALSCLRNGGVTPKGRSRHHGVMCANCPSSGSIKTIVGTRHRCLICADYDLCSRCYTSTSVHAMHQFVCRINPKEKWEPCNRISRPRVANMMQAVSSISSSSQQVTERFLALQHREITPNDYNTLLSLDSNTNASNGNSNRISSHINFSSTRTEDSNRTSLQEYLLEILSTYGGSRPSRRELMNAQQQQSAQRRILRTKNQSYECVGCHIENMVTTSSPENVGIRLPCSHRMHSKCLLQTFERGSYCCPHPECGIPIYRGLYRVTRKKKRERPSSSDNDGGGTSSNSRNSQTRIPVQQLLGPSIHIMGISEMNSNSISRADGNSNARTNTQSSGRLHRQSRSLSSLIQRTTPNAPRNESSEPPTPLLGSSLEGTRVKNFNTTGTTGTSSGSIHRRRPLSEHRRQRSRNGRNSSDVGGENIVPSSSTALEVQIVAARIHIESDVGGIHTNAVHLPTPLLLPPEILGVPAENSVAPSEHLPLSVTTNRGASFKEQRQSRHKKQQLKRSSKGSSRNKVAHQNQDPSPPSISVTPVLAPKIKPKTGRLRKSTPAQRLRPSDFGGGINVGFQINCKAL
jgi:hypothetical protein